MSDTQFTILIGVLGTFGSGMIAMLRWAVVQIKQALDANTVSHIESAKQMAILSTKIDFSYQASRDVKDFMVEERSGVHEVVLGPEDDTPPLGTKGKEPGYRKPATPPKGTAVVKIPLRKKPSDTEPNED